ncbi:MAG: cytochrome C oxidase subunit IV family protein [Planctomycetota bacterium]
MSAQARPRTHLQVLGILWLLTACSWLVSDHMSGAWMPVLILAIAAVKAALVVLVFMNMRRLPFQYLAAVLIALVLVGKLLGLIVGDVLLRDEERHWIRAEPGAEGAREAPAADP